MPRITPPEGGISVFDYNPELWSEFNEFYGYLWTHGALDQATKESARLRNARVTGCAICRNLRFDGALEQGLTEDYVEQIEDGYESSALPDRWKSAVRWTDTVIGFPADATVEQRDALAAQFTRAELVELTFAAAIAQGFSKAAVAWGPPEDIPVTVVPTPAPGTTVTDGSTTAAASA
jgi:AhpD family alkylhydroperoxidase